MLPVVPQPRAVRRLAGSTRVDPERLILLDTPDPRRLAVAAAKLQETVRAVTGRRPGVVAAAPTDHAGIQVSVVAGAASHPQGYELLVAQDRVHVVASTAAGAFYGAMTLCALIRRWGDRLPRLGIADWPDFPARGVLLDVSRGRVPTMETLFALVDRLSEWKVNQLQLYTEHTFAYRRHPAVWRDASPLTGEEILALDAYCRDRFVELVPNQNSLGHLRRWLRLPEYVHLAEARDGYDTPFGRADGPFSLCPTDPASLDFLRGLYDELLPHFSSRLFNVGADETDDIGQGRSRDAVSQRGFGRVYLEFLLALAREVRARGRTAMFWGDILLRHPELVPELPRDTIVLDWGYDADHDFESRTRAMVEAGVPFYVCPGTSSWDSIAGRSENAAENLAAAARAGAGHGAAGLLNCDWGDSGHWQPLAVSMVPFALGAAVAWHASSTGPELLAEARREAFGAAHAWLGDVAWRLGETYRIAAPEVPNGSLLFLVLRAPPDVTEALMAGRSVPRDAEPRILLTPTVARAMAAVRRSGLERALEHVEAQRRRLEAGQGDNPDAARWRRELVWVADVLSHACRRGLWIESRARGGGDDRLRARLAGEGSNLLARYEEIWLDRHRPGGLEESATQLRRSLLDYAA